MTIDLNSQESGIDRPDLNDESGIEKETENDIENGGLSNESTNAADNDNQTEKLTGVDQIEDSSEKDAADKDAVSNDDADAEADDRADMLPYDADSQPEAADISKEDTQNPDDSQTAVDISLDENKEDAADAETSDAANKADTADNDKAAPDEIRQNIDSTWTDERVQEDTPIIAEAQPSNETIRTDAKFERTPEAEADQSIFFDLDAAQQAEIQMEKPENANTGDIEKEMHPDNQERAVEKEENESQDILSEGAELKASDFTQDAHDTMEISEGVTGETYGNDTPSSDIESTRDLDSGGLQNEDEPESQVNAPDFDNDQGAYGSETGSDAAEIHTSAQDNESDQSPDIDLSEMYSLASDTAKEQAAAYLGTDNEDGQSTVTMDDVLSAPVESTFTDYAGEVREDATLSDLVAALNAFGEEAGVQDMGYDAFKDGVSSYQADTPDANPDVLNSLVVDVGNNMEIIDPGLDEYRDTDKADSDSLEVLHNISGSDMDIDSDDFVGNDAAENSLEDFKTGTEDFINQDPAFAEGNNSDNVDQGLDNDASYDMNNDFNKPDMETAQDADSDLDLQDFMPDDADFDWSDFDSDSLGTE